VPDRPARDDETLIAAAPGATGHDPLTAAQLTRRALLSLGAVAALAACSSGTPDAVGTTSVRPTGDAATPDPGSGSPSSPAASSTRPSAGSGGTPSPSSSPGAPATEVVHGDRSSTHVALTFHGAGDPRLAQGILAAAKAGGAHITVLAVGTWLQSYPAMGHAILDAGHELGNHTWHHRPMRQMSESSVYAEIVGGQKVVAAYTTALTWFRPSGTPHSTPAILAAAGRARYRTSLAFDVDPRDYADPGTSLVVSRTLAAVRGGSIVSLHLGHAGTVAALPKILDGLASRGLTPVTVSTLLEGVRP
jgi:peptidoglycan/xylan/chitin deacetylase (PgdA/CDA1 family)